MIDATCAAISLLDAIVNAKNNAKENSDALKDLEADINCTSRRDQAGQLEKLLDKDQLSRLEMSLEEAQKLIEKQGQPRSMLARTKDVITKRRTRTKTNIAKCKELIRDAESKISTDLQIEMFEALKQLKEDLLEELKKIQLQAGGEVAQVKQEVNQRSEQMLSPRSEEDTATSTSISNEAKKNVLDILYIVDHPSSLPAFDLELLKDCVALNGKQVLLSQGLPNAEIINNIKTKYHHVRMVVWVTDGVEELKRRKCEKLDANDSDCDDVSKHMVQALKEMDPDTVLVCAEYGASFIANNILQEELRQKPSACEILYMKNVKDIFEKSPTLFLKDNMAQLMEKILIYGSEEIPSTELKDRFEKCESSSSERPLEEQHKEQRKEKSFQGMNFIRKKGIDVLPDASNKATRRPEMYNEFTFPLEDPIGENKKCIIDLIAEEGKEGEDVLKEALSQFFFSHERNTKSYDLIRFYRKSNGILHVKIIILNVEQQKSVLNNLLYNQSSIVQKLNENQALKRVLKGEDLKIDLTAITKAYKKLVLKVDTLTEEQHNAINACTKTNTVHVTGPAGSGKTFIGLYEILNFLAHADARNDDYSNALFICKTKNLAFFVMHWLSHHQQSPKNFEENLYFYVTDEDMERRYIKFTYSDEGCLQEHVCSDTKELSAIKFQLIVIDEAHTIFNESYKHDSDLKYILGKKGDDKHEEDQEDKKRILILSDKAQSSSSSATEFPIKIDKTVKLNTITRSTKAIALGSLCYANCDTSNYKVGHECDGEKIQTILFDASHMTNNENEKMQEYAKQVHNTLGKIENNLPATDLDSDIAVFVPDTKFKKSIKKYLEKELDSTKYKIVSVADSLQHLNSLESKQDNRTRLVLATWDETRGLEYLIGIALAMDGSLLYPRVDRYGDGPVWHTEPLRPNPVVRCRMYVTSTRVQMALYFVNEIIYDGLLGAWLLAVRASEKRLKVAENRISKSRSGNASHQKSHAVIDFKKAAKDQVVPFKDSTVDYKCTNTIEDATVRFQQLTLTSEAFAAPTIVSSYNNLSSKVDSSNDIQTHGASKGDHLMSDDIFLSRPTIELKEDRHYGSTNGWVDVRRSSSILKVIKSSNHEATLSFEWKDGIKSNQGQLRVVLYDMNDDESNSNIIATTQINVPPPTDDWSKVNLTLSSKKKTSNVLNLMREGHQFAIQCNSGKYGSLRIRDLKFTCATAPIVSSYTPIVSSYKVGSSNDIQTHGASKGDHLMSDDIFLSRLTIELKEDRHYWNTKWRHRNTNGWVDVARSSSILKVIESSNHKATLSFEWKDDKKSNQCKFRVVLYDMNDDVSNCNIIAASRSYVPPPTDNWSKVNAILNASHVLNLMREGHQFAIQCNSGEDVRLFIKELKFTCATALVHHPNVLPLFLPIQALEPKLLLAAWNGRVEEVKMLLEKYPTMNVNYRYSDGRTALHFAAMNGHKEVCELLLNHKDIDIHPIDDEGDTPLDVAINNIRNRKDRNDMVALLIEKGVIARRYYRNAFGKWVK